MIIEASGNWHTCFTASTGLGKWWSGGDGADLGSLQTSQEESKGVRVRGHDKMCLLFAIISMVTPPCATAKCSWGRATDYEPLAPSHADQETITDTWLLDCAAITALAERRVKDSIHFRSPTNHYGHGYGFIARMPDNITEVWVKVKFKRAPAQGTNFVHAAEYYHALRNHPNIVKTYGFCEYEDHITVVQEIMSPLRSHGLCTKRELAQTQIKKPPAAAAIIKIAIGMVKSLQALDSVGHLLTDFNLRQWMLDADTAVKLVDFDCTRSTGRVNEEWNFSKTFEMSSKRHTWMIPAVIRALVSFTRGDPKKSWGEDRHTFGTALEEMPHLKKSLALLQLRWRPNDLSAIPPLASVASDLQVLYTELIAQPDPEL